MQPPVGAAHSTGQMGLTGLWMRSSAIWEQLTASDGWTLPPNAPVELNL